MVIDQVYRNGRYAYLIRYAVGPEPRFLSEDDRAWADELLRGGGSGSVR